jgi:uncharacterized phiE125 gp8 family phage protein
MTFRLTTAPTVEPISDEDVAAWGRKLAGEENVIAAWITAARELIETWTNRSLITRTYAQDAYCFPGGENAIEMETPGPWIAVSSNGFTYTDENGDSQTLDSADFQFDIDNGLIIPAYGETWPTARWQPRAVTISHTCGFGSSPADVPEKYRAALNATMVDWVENRAMRFELTPGVKQMLWAGWSGRWA